MTYTQLIRIFLHVYVQIIAGAFLCLCVCVWGFFFKCAAMPMALVQWEQVCFPGLKSEQALISQS